MKLHRIRLKNYRGIVEREIKFAERGVTIIEGPNEVGKTSIPEALGLAIRFRDNSTDRRVRSVRPVDRDDGTEVQFELSTGQYRLVFEKRWFRRSGTTLNVTALQNENHSGRAAHDRLNEILEETLDDNLRKALQIEQGTELNLPGFRALPSMRRALESAAGGEVSDSDEDTLMERIRDEYARYWTPRGRERRERLDSKGRIEGMAEEVRALEDRMEGIERDATELARVEGGEEELEGRLKEQEESEKELSAQWKKIEGMQTELERVVALHHGAESRRQQAFDRWSQREAMKRDVEDQGRELGELEAEAEKAAPALVAATHDSEEAAKALKEAREELRRARETHAIAYADRDFRQDEIDAQTLGTRYEAYLRNQKRLEESVDIIESTKVDEVAIQSIEEARDKVVEARSAFQSAAASVEATALSDILLEVNGEETRLVTNGATQVYVEEEVMIVVPDVVRFRVYAAKSSMDLVEDRRLAEEKYHQLCRSVGVADIEEARRKEAARKQAVERKRTAEEAINDALRDLSLEELRSKIRVAEQNVANYPMTRSIEPPMPPDLDEAKRIAAEAEGIVRHLEEKMMACEESLRYAEKQLEQTTIGDAVLRQRAQDARQQLEDATRWLEEARKETSDEALGANLATEQQGLTIVERELKEMREKLGAADPDSIEARLESVRGAKRRAENDRQENRRRRDELRGKLQGQGEEGLQGSLDDARSKFDQVKREHEVRERRAEEAKLLWETFERHRREAHQRYIQPFKERIDQFGRIVFGPSFEVELNEELEISSRTVDGVTLETDQLSTGAREQLGVISRLACAAIVSPDDGGVPVMIDDALGWSDPQRLQSMGAAINAAGKQCQIVILTCYPGRYAHVGDATVVNL